MAAQTLLPALFRALTLRERATGPGDINPMCNNPICNVDESRVQHRLKRWRALHPFHQECYFEQRLAQDGLSLESFLRLLEGAERPNLVDGATAPDWMNALAAAFTSPSPSESPCADQSEVGMPGFLETIAPLIRGAHASLRQRLIAVLAHYPHLPLPDAPSLTAMLYPGVQDRLEQILAPTLALELNVARLQNQLVGATPEERFTCFVGRLRQPEVARALVEEYPVLFRQAHLLLERWVGNSVELIERLCADWPRLTQTFGAGHPLAGLTRLAWKQHNTKQGGRSVVILTFASGIKLVYKPRPLAVEQHFQALLHWVNEQGFQPQFRLLRLLDRGGYGWMEWLDAQTCQSVNEVGRFYQRQGGLLALLYALEATDFHRSNIIAVGEHPMFIDLEALFHPRDADPLWSPMTLALDRATYHSVLRLGLLPEPELPDNEHGGLFDLSGLTGAGGQLTPYAIPHWEHDHTDEMHLVRKPVVVSSRKNLPTLHGQPVNLHDHRSAIDEGFCALYNLMVAQREQLLAPDGALARFVGDDVRVLARSGEQYNQLLTESYHPDLMRNALDRNRFLDRLWADVAEEPHLAHLIPHEQADLLDGDIPLFTTRVGSRSVYSSQGIEITDFFPQSGLAAAQARLLAFGAADRARQRWLIQAALATASGAEAATPPCPPITPVVAPPDLSRQLLDQARAIGDRLAQLAIHAGDEAAWLGVALVDNRHWLIEPSGADLYNGLPGVALFLAHLGKRTGEPQWTALAQAAITGLERLLAEAYANRKETWVNIGALNGLGGQLYVLAHLAVLWRQPPLLGAATKLAHTIPQLLRDQSHEESFNFADGLAGCLAGLLALYRAAPERKTLHAAHRTGGYLLRRLPATPDGASAQPANNLPFDSFYLGPLGAVEPLFQLAMVTGEARFAKAAASLLTEPAAGRQSTPGALLADLRALPWINDQTQHRRVATHVEHSLQTWVSQGLGPNHSLAHGAIGQLDLILQAGERLPAESLRPIHRTAAAALVAQMQQTGWATGAPLGVETPGLMAGLAGIGYGLLRLAAPLHTPSVLALEMPHGACS